MDIEQSFNRAFWKSFSWPKLVIVFPALVLCSAVVVFCRALYLDTNNGWVSLSLLFLPILLCFALLYSTGVLVTRMYQFECKQLPIHLKKILTGSLHAVLNTSYLSIPSIFFYLLLWFILGIFFLLKQIPGIGYLLNTILICVPFLLIFSSILLCVFNLLLLFFATPMAALFSKKRLRLAQGLISIFKKSPFSSFRLLFIGLLPLVLAFLFLSFALLLTSKNFIEGPSFLEALQWFFMLLPAMAFLTPAVIFFFNFSVEAKVLCERDE